MKILLIANGIVGRKAESVAGGEVRLIEIAKRWVGDGHEVHLLSGAAGLDLCKRLGLNVIGHEIAEFGGDGGRFEFILRTLRLLKALPRSLDSFTDGVVVSANEQLYDVLPGFVLKLKYRQRIRWAVVVHWLPPVRFWRRRESRLVNALLFLISERASLLLSTILADRLLAVSPGTFRQIASSVFPIRRVRMVECGVDVSLADKIMATKQAIRYDAVFMKRVQAVKGIFHLLEAWKRVVQVKPDAKVAVVGHGIDAESAKRRAKYLGLEHNVDFLGVVFDDAEKITILASSKLFVLPSLEENWAIVMGEAMSVGLPVLAYGLPELLEVWGDSFRPVEVGNSQALADALLDLLDDESARILLAQRGRRFIERLDWSVIATKEMEAIVEDR